MDIAGNRAATEQHTLGQAGSLGELLEQFRDRISPTLIDARGWDKLLERGRGLPASLGAFGFGFELPLHEIEPKADLGVTLIEGTRSAAHFKEWCRSQSADQSTTRLVRLLSEMAREQSDLRRIAGEKLLLEYDVDPAHSGAPPDPGIFLYPGDDVLTGDGSGRRLEDLRVVADAVAAAGGREPDAAERRQVERLFLAMTPDTRVGAIGTFPARPRLLRLAIMGFRKTCEMTAFLERTEWPGRAEAVVPLVSALEERGAFAHLGVHMDVRAGGVGSVLGVSCYASDTQWLKDIQPWMALTEGLREQNVALPEKLSALANTWAGAEAVFGRRGMLVVVRGIHHIKLVLAGDRCEQVKAYVFFLFFTPSQVAAATV